MDSLDKNRKILIVVDDLSAQGGTQTVALQFGKILAEQGNSIRYLSLKLPIKVARPDVFTLGIKRNYEILFKGKQIRLMAEENDLTIILSGQTFQYFIFISRSEKIIYRESNNPAYRHSVEPFWKSYVLRVMYRFFLLAKPNLTVQNKPVYEDLVRKSPRDHKIRLLANPCFFYPEPQRVIAEKRPFDMVYMSRHTQEKGSDRAEYIFQNTDLTGIVAGTNDYFARAENRKDILYVGRVDDLTGHYKSAKFLLLPSRVEGFPNCVHEAIQCGTRILASEELSWLTELSPEMASAVTLVNCQDHASMARQISKLVRCYQGPIPIEVRERIRRQFDPYRYLEKLINE